MPVTPFHVGAGLVVKGAAPEWFSLSVFTLVQLIIDSEVLARLALGIDPLHGHLHTLGGSTGVAVAALTVGRPVCMRLKKWWNANLDSTLRSRLSVKESIPFVAAMSGAFIGAWSHVFLDGIMHPDVRLLAPLRNSNPYLNMLTMAQLHFLCIALAVAGLAWLWLRRPGQAGSKDMP